jgi:hypothetical protein
MIMIDVVVVIVVIPVAIRVPAMGVFIPPTMIVFPAIGARFREFFAPVLRLRTVVAMVLDGFMQLTVGAGGALLAFVIGADRSSTSHKQETRKGNRGQNSVKEFHANPPVIQVVQISDWVE